MGASALLVLLLSATPSPPPDATPTRRGLVNTENQAFSGTKTFDGGIVTPLINGAAPVTATIGPVTLFVDPAGNNANACTSSGTGACATVSGAVAKLPPIIAHNATINVAPGTYTDTVQLTGFHFLGSNTLHIAGGPVTFNPTTGSATGTITAFVDQPDNFTARGVLTDSSQNWTVNELRGRFLEITSGPASGQLRTIAENTATTITFAGAFATDPTVGNTYRLVTSGPVWSSGGMTLIAGNFGNGIIRATYTRQSSNLVIENNHVMGVQLGGAQLICTTGSCITVRGSRLTLSTTALPPSYIENLATTNSSGINLISPFSTVFSLAIIGNVVMRTNGNTVTGLTAAINASDKFTQATNTTLYVQVPFGSKGIEIDSADVLLPSNTRTGVIIDCTGAPGAVGIRFNRSTTGGSPRLTSAYSLFLNCGTAVSVDNKGHFNMTSGFFSTYVGVTNEYMLDGVPYSQAFIQSLSPRIVTNAIGSSISYGLP